MPDIQKTAEDRLLETVEKIGEQTANMEKSLDARLSKVEVTVGSAIEDQKKLADHVKEVAKGSASLDESQVESIVGKIMDKFEAENAAKGLRGAGAATVAKFSDPWDTKAHYFANEFLKRDGKAIDVLKSAMLSTPTSDMHKVLQHQAVDIAIFNALGQAYLRQGGDSKYADEFGRFSIAKAFPRIHRKWMDVQRGFLSEFTGKAALDPNDTADVSNWVPTLMSPDVREKIMLATSVGSLFEHIQFTGAGKQWDVPVDLTDVLPDFIPETTAYTNPYAAADPTQLGQTLNDAKQTYIFGKHRARFIFSGELDEDSMVAIAPRVRDKLVRTLANGEEKIIIDGQKTADIDTGGGGVGTYDIRNASDGIRYFCSSGVANVLYNAGSDNLATSDLFGARALMGEYGVNPSELALIVGVSGYMQALKLAEVITADKFGPQATIFQGALAAVAGMPVVVSRYIREDLNASGIYDATTTTQTCAIVVNKRGWLAVEKRDITIESVRLPQTDQTDVIAMRRIDFNQFLGTGNKVAAVIYNLDTALA